MAIAHPEPMAQMSKKYILFALFSYIYILDVVTEKPCSKSLECNVVIKVNIYISVYLLKTL